MSLLRSPYHVKQSYRRYTWVSNRISPETMAEMHRIRKTTGKTMTRQVAEAVDLHVKTIPLKGEQS